MDSRSSSLVLAIALVLASAIAWAGDDHERARAAREAGKIVSLQTILDRVQSEFKGTLLEVELDDDDDRWIYKVELLAPGGAKIKLEYDARDGRLLQVKQRKR